MSAWTEDAFAWLNSRATALTIKGSDGKPVTIWEPTMEITIEEAIEWYCESNDIDIVQEVSRG